MDAMMDIDYFQQRHYRMKNVLHLCYAKVCKLDGYFLANGVLSDDTTQLMTLAGLTEGQEGSIT